jgi:uncharacterized protein
MPDSQSFRTALIEYIRKEARPVDKFSHQPRLYALATRIGEGRVYDDDVLFAAAWVHDLGVFYGHRPEDLKQLARWDNVAYAIERAPGVLTEIGFPQAKIPAVLEVVRTHQPSAEPTCIEGVLLRDADILEQLGAIGVLRTVSKIGRDTRFPTFAPAIETLKRNLAELPSKLRLEAARALAMPKVEILKAFLSAAAAESQGEAGETALRDSVS